MEKMILKSFEISASTIIGERKKLNDCILLEKFLVIYVCIKFWIP